MSRRQKAPGELGRVTPRKLSSGRWQARVEIRDGLGKLVPLSATADNEAGAILAIAEKANAVWSGAFIEVTEDTTVEALSNIWINQLRQADTQPTTLQQYAVTVRTLINTQIAAYRIGSLTPAFCDGFLRKLATNSPSKAKKARNALTQMLRIAVLHGVFSHNPVLEVGKLPGTKSVKVSYDDEQVTVLLRLLRQYQGNNPGRLGGRRPDTQVVEDVIRLALGTSARIGEVLAFREEDVRFGDRTTVHINGTIIRLNTEHAGADADGQPADLLRRQNYPKHKDQDRVVHVADFAVEPLRRLVAGYRQNKYELLFFTDKGKPRDPANIRRTLRAFRNEYKEELEAMGIDIERLTPKAFRKTAATVVSEELGVEAAQGLLGHWSEQVTKSFYIVEPDVVTSDTADALSRRFSGI